MRSATIVQRCVAVAVVISIHALHAECDPNYIAVFLAFVISIHALHAECDSSGQASWRKLTKISIHALHAECDLPQQYGALVGLNFNPRTPCGVRRQHDGSRKVKGDFNPRTPCGVRHCGFLLVHIFLSISIHALHAECDVLRLRLMNTTQQPFQSTHSMRSATRPL